MFVCRVSSPQRYHKDVNPDDRFSQVIIIINIISKNHSFFVRDRFTVGVEAEDFLWLFFLFLFFLSLIVLVAIYRSWSK